MDLTGLMSCSLQSLHIENKTYHDGFCRRKEVKVDIEGLGLTKVNKIFTKELVMLYIISLIVYNVYGLQFIYHRKISQPKSTVISAENCAE